MVHHRPVLFSGYDGIVLLLTIFHCNTQKLILDLSVTVKICPRIVFIIQCNIPNYLLHIDPLFYRYFRIHIIESHRIFNRYHCDIAGIIEPVVDMELTVPVSRAPERNQIFASLKIHLLGK